jgi:protein AIR1/2
MERRAEQIGVDFHVKLSRLARAMTSTAVVEIIDLTDGHSSIDDDAQKIPKPETYGTDAVPEKSATQTVHKRKNGEVDRARSQPPESRGVSVERGHVLSREATESQLAEGIQGKDGEPTRKKKRRSKKSKDKDKDSSSPREDTQHDTPTLDDGKLFFTDTAPAPVPAGMAFDSNDGAKGAQSSAQASEVDRVPLLLPAHVSVVDPGEGLPVQLVQSADPDSDSESYIEYLDYDDRLVRR